MKKQYREPVIKKVAFSYEENIVASPTQGESPWTGTKEPWQCEDAIQYSIYTLPDGVSTYSLAPDLKPCKEAM